MLIIERRIIATERGEDEHCVAFRPCTITAVAMTFATYILQPFYPHCELPFLVPQLLAAGCISKRGRERGFIRIDEMGIDEGQL